MGLTRAHVAFPLFFLLLIFSVFINPIHANPDELFISTNKHFYGLGATINVLGTLTYAGNPVTNGLVAVNVEDSNGNVRLIRVAPTGNPPSPWKVGIVEFISCDMSGNPKNSFSRGSLACFKVTVQSLDMDLDRAVIVALNLFDPAGFSIGVTFGNFTLAPGKSATLLASIPIPSDAFVGQAICCANALTKWPKDSGQPYCAETRVQVAITGSSSQSTGPPSISSASPPGSFNMSFKLPNDASLGKYAVYASARYNAWAETAFTHMWLRTDINTDGKINIVDISITALAFGSRNGDPKYNSLADINEDKIINIIDITQIALDYGKSRS